MPSPETDVLKPREASLHEDHWAEFVLSDASVVYESNGKPASLLLAFPDTPLKVQGRLLTPPREHAHYLQKKTYKPTEIVVRNVTRYAYAEMADRTYVLWALGEAGWFEIQPAAHYKPTHDEMLQAVEILYFVTDLYSGPRKKGGGPSASLVYREYAEDDRFSCSDKAEAERIFHKHREFLLMSWLKRVNDIGWSNTPLYQTIKRHFPKDFERCKARSEGRLTDVQPERISRTSRTSPPPTAITSASRRVRANGHDGAKATTPRADAPPKKDDNWWEAATLFEFMQKAVNQRVIRAGRSSITVDRVAQLIIKRFEIEDVATARSVLLVHAQNLCYMMDHPRRANVRFFAAEPIYGELAAGHNLPASEQRRAEGIELRRRKTHGTLRGENSESSDTSDEDDEGAVTTPQRRPARSKKGTLSVLRPMSGKFSGKGKSIRPAGKGKTKPPIPVSDSDPDTATGEDDAMAIDTPTQALSPGSSKRKLEDLEDPTSDKRLRSTSPSSPPASLSTSPDPEPGTADPPLPLRYLPTQQQPSSKSTQPILPALVSTPLPTYESNGPRDSWICTFDGCAQRIYGCSKDIGRQLITEHLEDHTKGREKVVGILWREQDRLHLPVK
ncbi:hypothetical protein E8E13_002085 [Curvularia kusanoi]|uniref:DNA (cytosine-5)-methyltransferase 1 replication foci domain-containing protein n=1 Tax=Curvularia kusanoi TaxID=90978 RepID=A0A9P4W6V9_CURKU|nr:hypothetical protein E8E13_002085 [Curvularia kusanoi]